MRAAIALLALAVTVRVPFDFRAGGVRFAPGEYVLTLGEASEGTMTIRGASGEPHAFAGVHRAGDPAERTASIVSFRAYGDRRFLAAIEVEGGGRWEVAASPDEAALARTQGEAKVTRLRAH